MKALFGIIGCGRIAHRHAEQMKKQGKLLAVCDIDVKKAKDFAEKYDTTYYSSIEELLAKETQINIIAVCTPNGLHAEHTIKSLNAKKHVLCEKPLAIKTADAMNMINCAAENDCKLFVVKQNRYNPPVVAVKQLLDNNTLGKISSFQVNCFWNRPEAYYAESSWRGTKELDGGTLFTQFSHFVDLIYWFLGDVKSAEAKIANFAHKNIAIEDAGIVLLEMENGTIGTLNYTVNAHQQNMEGSFTIFGEKGTVKIGGQYLNELEYQNIQNMDAILLQAGNAANSYGYYQGSMSNHDKVYENLLAAIENDSNNIASAEDGLKTVEIIEKIYNAAL
jgi:UDP-N-acetyl-2-amino-2-deoxyglucuronate dehydrogenase